MKRLLIPCVLGVILLAAAAVGCGGGSDGSFNRIEQPGRGWTTMKSPITGRCFEAFSSGREYGFAKGIAEIPCDEHVKFQASGQ